MKELSPQEELKFLKDIHQDPQSEKAYAMLRDSFNVLQARSQMLLGLVTICLTITGFSGIKIAESGMAAKTAIFFGITSTLITALLLVVGPLNLRWLTKFRAGSVEDTLIDLIRRRDQRTRLYHLASAFLILGVGGYTLSLAFYLLGK
ncbi:MAG: hypothetical protein HRT88_07840 [Lentisphaeraceae bacterium]|nr:hypothetical protein [Lentisphaeraceae bacterium]